VLFLEPKRIYRSMKQDVPEGVFEVALGKARTVREGKDVTLVTFGAMVSICEKAAEDAEGKGMSVEIVDLRTLMPLDEESILTSVMKTGRLVVVQEAPRFCSFSGEISAIVAEKAIEYLQAPILRVAGFDTPFPYALEHVYMPDSKRVLAAIERAVNF
jgi:pyruvate/2-oxoglutarate/acetoin dehydrogenase E1 component